MKELKSSLLWLVGFEVFTAVVVGEVNELVDIIDVDNIVLKKSVNKDVLVIAKLDVDVVGEKIVELDIFDNDDKLV
jgi:hypothetical protein